MPLGYVVQRDLLDPQGPEGPALNLYQDTDMDGVEDWLEVVVGTDATDSGDTPPLGDDGVVDLLQVEGPQGIRGEAGVSVAGALVNLAGELIITLTDSTTINVGNVVGPAGATGAQGEAGPIGEDGATIEQALIDEQGAKLFMSDGRLLTAAGAVKGPQGDTGPQGEPGIR